MQDIDSDMVAFDDHWPHSLTYRIIGKIEQMNKIYTLHKKLSPTATSQIAEFQRVPTLVLMDRSSLNPENDSSIDCDLTAAVDITATRLKMGCWVERLDGKEHNPTFCANRRVRHQSPTMTSTKYHADFKEHQI